MKICEVTITAHELDKTAAFYRDVLQMPVDQQPARVEVTIGSTRLAVVQGEPFDGVHHLAFGVSPHDFARTRTWLNERVEPIVVDGSEVIDGPEGWNSESVYFLGPEKILLEFIARQADAEVPASDETVPRPLSISEVGIGVPDVGAAVRELSNTLGIPAFSPQSDGFAPVGEHDGLLILVDRHRLWFPIGTHQAARGLLQVRVDASERPSTVGLTDKAIITAAR